MHDSQTKSFLLHCFLETVLLTIYPRVWIWILEQYTTVTEFRISVLVTVVKPRSSSHE
ncbi:hypothetical protein C8J55DRAFT_526771 [Lentinula edodes]|uniref:Uncharacterized protein n=1 Tax=Lentinula lateritia TaxID=40482 RepID=A0A9W8ZUQ1_9AGAR|nr:hypothetical protein C8J55DRAFT_526771 [Lentinula edodes]